MDARGWTAGGVEWEMERVSALIFPGGRTLAGWWRQLAPVQPQGLWIGYAFVHRIEAAVNVRVEQPIDSLTRLLLQALQLEETLAPNHLPGVRLAALEERLRLPSAVILRLLAGLSDAGLITASMPERWQASEAGRRALERRAFPVRVQKRRTFPFLECVSATGERLAAPHFVPIAECPGAAWAVAEPHRFDSACFRDSLEQPLEWKQAVGFPLDVEALAEDAVEPWQRIVVDRPERVMLAFVKTQGGTELLGFTAKVDGWTLHDRAPVLRVPFPIGTIWPEIAIEPATSVWQDAWRSWCRQRQLPANEVDSCTFSYRAPRLEIQAPPRLVQRLHAAKSDLFKGEAWLLVGDGYCRTAVQLAVK